MTTTLRDAPRHLRARRLAHLVAGAAHAPTAHVDEHYDLTAIVIERPTNGSGSQTVVVELIHTRNHAEHRWSVLAIDELRDLQTPLSHGRTAREAIAGIAWTALDS